MQAKSEEMQAFVASMPDWTTPVAFVSDWQGYKLDMVDVDGL
jgi:hypothetical protein